MTRKLYARRGLKKARRLMTDKYTYAIQNVMSIDAYSPYRTVKELDDLETAKAEFDDIVERRKHGEFPGMDYQLVRIKKGLNDER